MYVKKGILFLKMKKYDDAIKCCDISLNIDPNHTDAIRVKDRAMQLRKS